MRLLAQLGSRPRRTVKMSQGIKCDQYSPEAIPPAWTRKLGESRVRDMNARGPRDSNARDSMLNLCKSTSQGSMKKEKALIFL